MFNDNLKALRQSCELSQKEMAEALHISSQRYNHYETGRNQPDFDTLKNIANFFKIPVDTLLSEDISNDNIDSNIPEITAFALSLIKSIKEFDKSLESTKSQVYSLYSQLGISFDNIPENGVSDNTNESLHLLEDEKHILNLYRLMPEKVKGKAELLLEQLAEKEAIYSVNAANNPK